MRTAATTILMTLLLGLSAPLALAQSPTQQGYDRELGVIGEIQSVEPDRPEEREQEPQPAPTPPPPERERQEAGSLPFTGLELGAVAVLGVALLGTGFALRRVSRRGDSLA